jgi:hypothetical protein
LIYLNKKDKLSTSSRSNINSSFKHFNSLRSTDLSPIKQADNLLKGIISLNVESYQALSDLDKQLSKFNQDQKSEEARTHNFLAKVNAHITSNKLTNNNTSSSASYCAFTSSSSSLASPSISPELRSTSFYLHKSSSGSNNQIETSQYKTSKSMIFFVSVY